MGPRSTPGPSSHLLYPALSPSYNEQDDSVSLSQGEYLSGNIPRSGLEEIQNIGGSHAYNLPVFYEYPSIQHPVPGMANHQSHSHDPSLLSSQVPALPFPTDPFHPETPDAAFTPYAYPSGWRGADRRMEQEEIETHNPLPPQDIYDVSVLSASPELSSHTMIAGTPSSLSGESYIQPGWQDDNADLTSFSCGRVESATTEDLVATQGQIATTQQASLARGKTIQRKGKDKARKQVVRSNNTREASLAHERQVRKKEQDKARKKTERLKNKRAHSRICQLLDIELDPINTLADRILDGVEGMAERLEVADDLRHRLQATEAYLHFLTAKLGKLPTGADIGSFLNAHTTPGDSDIGAALRL